MRTLLREMPTDSAAVLAELEHWLERHPHLRTLAVFAALPGEVDLAPLVDAHPEKCWAYPLVRDRHLTFHAVLHPEKELLPGSFGILEPLADSPEVPVAGIDAFLCPGLAFDENGGRLGRGRGFYDRVLARANPSAVKIGVCFQFQRVPDTFSEAHDIHMDLVISEG